MAVIATICGPFIQEMFMRKLVVTLVALLAIFTFIRDFRADGNGATPNQATAIQSPTLP